MKIYLFQRNDANIEYDEHDEIVVKAQNEENAKRVACEYSSLFAEPDVKITEINLDNKEEVILASFYEG